MIEVFCRHVPLCYTESLRRLRHTPDERNAIVGLQRAT
jgi:hypothetical protein